MAILLVRHAQSEGNVNEKVHGEMGDHAIPLSTKGQHQAIKAGEFLNNYLSMNLAPPERSLLQKIRDTLYPTAPYKPKVRLWASPYLRTTQTAQGILKGAPDINWDENPMGGNIFFDIRLREREFGYQDGMNDEEVAQNFPIQNAHHQKTKLNDGKIYTRPFGGESGADVLDRAAGFKESLYRDILSGKEHHVIVNHGYTQRCFVTMFLHLHPKHFQLEENPANTEIRLLDKDPVSKRYVDYGAIYIPAHYEENETLFDKPPLLALTERPKHHKIYKLAS